MLSTNIINRIYILVFLLQYTHAQAPIPTQSTLAAANYPSALILKGTGLAGSVVAAKGCDITYEFKCTASSTVCVEGDVVQTVTLNGPSASQTYQMNYISVNSTTTGVASELCTLHGTTVAYCHAEVSLTLGTLSNSITSSFVLTDQGALGYQQVPITAGPAAALKSVSSCSASGGGAVSTAVFTTTEHLTSATGRATNSKSTSSSTGTGTPDSGLSTGAIAGIGAGIGAAGAVLLVAGGVILFRRRQKAKARERAAANATQNFGHPQQFYPQQPAPYGVELSAAKYGQPSTQYEMPAGREVQELSGSGYQKPHELPTYQR